MLSQRVSHSVAVAYIENMKSPDSQFLIKRADEALEEEAIQIFKGQTSKNTSYVDCTNMAFMKQLHADALFSFDGDYRKNGFTLVEDLLKSGSSERDPLRRIEFALTGLALQAPVRGHLFHLPSKGLRPDRASKAGR